jgi:hypothetical protein
LGGLQEALKTSQSLQQLARKAVHCAFGSRLPRMCVPQLRLPEPLRAHLFYPDLDTSAMLHAYNSSWQLIRAETLFK